MLTDIDNFKSNVRRKQLNMQHAINVCMWKPLIPLKLYLHVVNSRF